VDLVRRQTAQLNACHVAGAVQLGQRRGQRMGPIHLHITVSADFQNSSAVQIARNVE
jgi:hypothetical protein